MSQRQVIPPKTHRSTTAHGARSDPGNRDNPKKTKSTMHTDRALKQWGAQWGEETGLRFKSARPRLQRLLSWQSTRHRSIRTTSAPQHTHTQKLGGSIYAIILALERRRQEESCSLLAPGSMRNPVSKSKVEGGFEEDTEHWPLPSTDSWTAVHTHQTYKIMKQTLEVEAFSGWLLGHQTTLSKSPANYNSNQIDHPPIPLQDSEKTLALYDST